ncbi:unnamed protein product [Paramecium sonneborni]|uniref:PSI domain-containing protein n=1 Tax=Paramecium sonneborni TaxID=65129 RepID=A0A8S1PKN6_9CILI|nr:unnamed protein product [Paramecium sonneborni]
MVFRKLIIVFFLQFLLTRCQETPRNCVCGHVNSQNECLNSGYCFWEKNVCVLRSGQTYNKEIQNENPCKNFAEDDCRIQEKCGFYLGQCIDFINCSIFNSETCQESSFRCVSDGNKCAEMLECNNYITQDGCMNKNQKGKYCFWDQEVKNCVDVKNCEELPLLLVSHSMCKEGLDECTITDKQYGCMKQKESCSQYLNDFQCYESVSKSQNCFWDSQNKQCLEKVCQNLPFIFDYQCKSYLKECTSNGIHCIKRKQCSDAKTKYGCVTDVQGNKCEYHQNECKIKSCNTAPESLKNYQQCQDYDNLLDCVTSENGGCKQRPTSCEGYVNEMDCYSKEQQDCVWYNNKCEQRQCYHAPVHFSFQDCKQYEEPFCELNYKKEKCIWLNNSCMLLECNKLKLPTYKNHKICQMASQYCTFNLDSFGCTDYLCDNVQEIEYCQIDSLGTDCPSSNDSNEKCEQWLPQCTVNVQVLQNTKILIGCLDKKNDCKELLQDQCYTTIQGFNCKWNNSSKICENQNCTDANPNLYKTNQDCRLFKVFSGSCIINSTRIGCQSWPINCNQMGNQEQCQLNLKNETLCFWTGSYCKTLECSDAPKNEYRDNIQCNKWLKHCIYNSELGGCRNRPNPLICTSSPNSSMYDNHEKCFAWNPKCTVISSIQAEGCELKKTNCYEYIRKRNCRTNLSGQNCYWDDSEGKCKNEDNNNDGIPDCNKRVLGNLTHEDCEEFLSTCTISNFNRHCSNLQSYCHWYTYQQHCVITREQQPCKWDDYNQKCIDVKCVDNQTAETEAECLRFKRFFQCQLKINSNGSYGPGCENRPYYCSQITNSTICNLTFTYNNQKCYYFNSSCQSVPNNECISIRNSTSHAFCQLYNKQCILQTSGLGCYSINNCLDLSNEVCNNATMKFNIKCNFYISCRRDLYCSDKYRQLCSYIYTNGDYYCREQISEKTLNFSSTNFQIRTTECQNYSSTYRYDTTLMRCIQITSCSQQSATKQICDLSIVRLYENSLQKCGFNSLTNQCENRKCEHVTSAATDKSCYDWNFNCVPDTIGCKTYTDCTQIQLIYQCYSFSQCYWQDSKCVRYVNCQVNTNAISDLECLLINAQFCRLNYTKGQGCSFTNCGHVMESSICNSTSLVDGRNCYWSNGCYHKNCSSYSTQSECESSYGYNSYQTTRCYWCQYNSTSCSYNKYCSPNSMSQIKSHEDCNNQNVSTTIYFSFSQKCTVKKQTCEEYTYENACVSTLDGIKCYWESVQGICKNICVSLASNSNLDCFNFHPYCMLQQPENQCMLLNCIDLIETDCIIFTQKCFWNDSECQNVGDCNEYLTEDLCFDTKNKKGIPCFWDEANTQQCIEKTCENKSTISLSQSDCDSWLQNCKFNQNSSSCVGDCSQAGITYLTHQQCESYFINKNCTLKLDIIQCVDLPYSCSFAWKSQCYQDRYGKLCYFQASSNQCVDLECINLDASYTTHNRCNQKLQTCTVNTTLNGCQLLQTCDSYQQKEQCQFDQNYVACEWMINQNKCTIKNCSTAQLNEYSAYSCQLYLDNSCTVNQQLDGCEVGQSLCMMYTYNQCISTGQKNLNGKPCFWDNDKNTCLEKMCENGPSMAKSHSDCFGFLSTCQKGGCRIKDCFDYNYAIDSACASIFYDKRCVTNGYNCILRQACEDAQMIDGCPFDKNLNPCVWVNDKCLTKTCQTALNQLTKYEECINYLPHCTVQQEGGCTQKKLCQDYLFKEACNTNDSNEECIWDDYLNKCFYITCIDQCGDGIVTTKEEQCDDGNYLPYDGCYKCQIQCPQGCNICNGRFCVECQKQGWKLENSVCISICGDGYKVGKEQCDDGNSIEYDGCYQCSYSCHKQCIDCYQGQCIQCPQGYLENGAQCLNVCGDGYLVKPEEQCDDGNRDSNDGCNSNCFVEQNWKCQESINNLSICNYMIIPYLILTKLTKTNVGIQEFQLSFSEPIRLNVKGVTDEQFQQMIIITILNTKDSNYDFEIKPITPISTELTDTAYKILLNFKTFISNPILKVLIQSNDIVNVQNNTLYSNEIQLELKSPNKISDDQQSLIAKTAEFSQMLALFFCVVIQKFYGISLICFNNYHISNITQIYFEIFKFGSFTPIFINLNTPYTFQNIFDFQIPNIPAKWKFKEYQINCYFLDTFQTLLFMILLGFAYYILSFIFYKLLFLIKYQNLPAILYRLWESDIYFKIARFVYSFQKISRKYFQYFFFSGLLRILASNFYEITFASILQMINFNSDTFLNKIISFLALIMFIFNLFVLTFIYSYLSKKSKVKKSLSILIEGVKSQNNNGSKQYFTIILVKKTLFIINLVVFQELVTAQSIITACISGIYCCYIQIYKPFENNYENIKIFYTEILIVLNTMIFPVYEVIKRNQNKDIASILGWINVGCFTLILVLNLLIDIYQQLIKYVKILIAKLNNYFWEEKTDPKDQIVFF